MPSKEISQREYLEVMGWLNEHCNELELLFSQDKGVPHGPSLGWSADDPRYLNHSRMISNGRAWNVGGEPVILYEERYGLDKRRDPMYSLRLYCSEKHAHELEEAGIVIFSESQQDVQTS